MILEGWLETSPPPQGPSKTYINEPQTTGTTKANANKRKRREEMSDHYHRRAWLQPTDLNPQKTVEMKQHKYAPLIEELVKEGWNVDPTVHVIRTVGVRATVPIRNVEVLENLGIKDKPAQQKVQASMAHVAAAHLNRIVPQYRRLCARINKPINANKTGIG
jgi:tRNA/tmRNA/rRNA uracil-C5-methylase (TrmA/RlmC/RlmD family)